MPATLSPAPGVLMVHGGPGGDLVTLLETVTLESQREATEAEVRERLGSAGESLVLCGHTHVQRARRLGDGRLVVNPGSVGLSAYEDDDPYPHRVEAGSPHARWALLTRRDGAWTVEMRRTAYDWDAAAEAADAQGRRGWVRPLREGRV
jgi:diadenosine tetraphosphatase ApaH/serine/threonine PP2A family protein phosphatase